MMTIGSNLLGCGQGGIHSHDDDVGLHPRHVHREPYKHLFFKRYLLYVHGETYKRSSLLNFFGISIINVHREPPV